MGQEHECNAVTFLNTKTPPCLCHPIIITINHALACFSEYLNSSRPAYVMLLLTTMIITSLSNVPVQYFLHHIFSTLTLSYALPYTIDLSCEKKTQETVLSVPDIVIFQALSTQGGQRHQNAVAAVAIGTAETHLLAVVAF